MTATEALFQEHWRKLSPREPATEAHFAHFLELQREFPMLPVSSIVAFTLDDFQLRTWDEVNG